MACQNNFQCRDVAIGWKERRGIVIDAFKMIKQPVDRAHYFQIFVTGKEEGATYQLQIDNTIVRDIFTLKLNETKEYLNGLLTTGQRLTIIATGEIKYTFKWIRKNY